MKKKVLLGILVITIILVVTLIVINLRDRDNREVNIDAEEER